MSEDSQDAPRPLAEISHGPSAFEAFLDRNTKGLIVGAVLLAVVGGAVIVYRGMQEASAQAAGADLSKAVTVAELQAVTKDHPKSPAAGSAQILLAEKQWADGDQDGAIETLRGFITAYPEHPALQSAKASLATRLLQQGKSGDAQPLFRDLADSGRKYIAPYALIQLGDLAKKEGKLDEAEAAYKQVEEKFGSNPTENPFADTAAKHLKLVSFKMPAEIEAPAPPPAPAPAPGAPGAALTPDKIEMPAELEGNPLGNILSEGGPAVPPAPVEEEPAKPETAPPTPPAEQPQPEPESQPQPEPTPPPAEQPQPETPPAGE